MSVAEARHMVRERMLLQALDELHTIGMNRDNRVSDRINALQFIVDFGAEAQGNGSKQVGKLSPAAARLIAKLGLNRGGVSPPQAEEQRLGSGGTEGDKDGNDPEGTG